MTKTALRALITVAAAGAVLFTASPALADGATGEPTCAPGELFDPTIPACVAQQLPEESIGGARCPDPDQVVISVDPYVCGYPQEVPSAAPAPSAGPAPQAAPAPVAPRPQAAPAAVAGSSAQPASAPALGAPTVGPAVSPEFRALLDQVIALVQGWFSR